jgi:sterol desaturase/sphingolipid hydroxylase (fatty acid hydroxylase superfamily)
MAGLEPYWDALMERHGPWVNSPWGILVVHEVVYFGCWLPYLAAEFLPALRKYKLQPNVVNDAASIWRCMKLLLFLHVVIEFPMMYLTHPAMAYFGIRTSGALPQWHTLAWQMVVFFLIEDFYFYWIHRFLHWKRIYKYIHKVHHVHTAPFGIAAEYAHPVETMFLGFGTIFPPVLFSWFQGMHLLTLYTWLIVRLFQTVEVHTGYDFPWSLNRWLPGWAGAEFHDFHHMTFDSNFSSTFRIWDNVFGTAAPYYEYKGQQRKLAAAASNGSSPAGKLAAVSRPVRTKAPRQ